MKNEKYSGECPNTEHNSQPHIRWKRPQDVVEWRQFQWRSCHDDHTGGEWRERVVDPLEEVVGGGDIA